MPRYAIDAGDGIEVHACISGDLTPETRDALAALGRAAMRACACGNGEAEDDRGAVLRCAIHGPDAFRDSQDTKEG